MMRSLFGVLGRSLPRLLVKLFKKTSRQKFRVWPFGRVAGLSRLDILGKKRPITLSPLFKFVRSHGSSRKDTLISF